jgi:hypothetical protein
MRLSQWTHTDHPGWLEADHAPSAEGVKGFFFSLLPDVGFGIRFQRSFRDITSRYFGSTPYTDIGADWLLGHTIW